MLQVKIQAGVEYEQVVKIYETIIVEEKEMFIIMEYCEGGNLLQWIKRRRRHNLINQTVKHYLLETRTSLYHTSRIFTASKYPQIWCCCCCFR